MSTQYTAGVSNVVYDPLDGAGLDTAVAADNIEYNKVTFVGPTVDTERGKNTSSSTQNIEGNTISTSLIPPKSTAVINTQSTGVSSSGASTTIDLSSDEVEMEEILEVGDFILTNLLYMVRVKTVSGYVITVDNAPDGTASASAVTGTQFWLLDQNAFVNDTPGEYSGFLVDSVLAGGATAPNKANNATTKVRTVRTGTAIRSGYWNVFTGKFTTEPTNADDTSALAITSDNAYTQGGKITYTGGGISPTSVAYNA